MVEEAWEDLPLFSSAEKDVPKLEGDEPVPEDVNDSFAMLSHLLYDEDTPAEQSEQMREKGNAHFKLGSKYALRKSIEDYTKAIEIDGLEPKIRALGYLNRSAAEMKLSNFGRALTDAKLSIQLDKANGKAYWRGAFAANRAERWQEALDLSSSGILLADSGTVSTKLLEAEVLKAKKGLKEQRDKEERQRRKEQEQKQAAMKTESLYSSRNLRLGPPLYAQQRKYQTTEPQLGPHGELSYPVLFVYPAMTEDESMQSDYIEDFGEFNTMQEYLDQMLPPPWDLRGIFVNGNVEALYRQKWTISPEEAEEIARLGDSIPSDYVGSERGPEEVGSWVKISLTKPLREGYRPP